MKIKKAFALLLLAIMFSIISVFAPLGSIVLEGSLNSTVYANEQGINQSASTSGGTVKRYIDISSPWSHGYLHEDMSVVGKASITESFTMDNMSPGSKAGSGFDEWDIGPSGGSSESSAEGNEGSASTEVNSSAGSEGSAGSSSSESSTVAAEEKASPPKEAVLGISIFSYPTWLDLF